MKVRRGSNRHWMKVQWQVIRDLSRCFPTDPRYLCRIHAADQPLSLDEAYLEVTENLKDMPIATEITLEIRAKNQVSRWSQCISRHSVQQVFGQDGVGSQQAERPDRHQPEERPSFRRRTSGQEISRCGPTPRRCTASASKPEPT